MGIYQRYVFPRLMEWAIGNREHLAYRREALAEARGHVLELGFGTGLNLACYPHAVTELTAVDPGEALTRRVEQRVAAAAFPVHRLRRDAADRLPLPDGSFDTVASTWTLCTIPDPLAALREARRLLRPEGRYLFLEHGLSDDPRVARWQRRLDPVERVLACGCHLSRPIDRLFREAGFRILRLERFLVPKAPRLLAEAYRGTAAP